MALQLRSFPEEIKGKVKHILKSKDSDEVTFGYMMPGHGYKGKQHALLGNDDVTDMYDLYKGKKTPIILWAKVKVMAPRARKRLRELSDNDVASKKQKPGKNLELKNNEPCKNRSNYQNHLNKMAEVDTIVKELEEKHSDG